MPALHIVLDVDEDGLESLRRAGLRGRPAEQSIIEQRLIHLGEDAYIELGVLPRGMESGAPSLVFAFTLPAPEGETGKVVLAETSLKLLLTAADAIVARYGDPR